MFHCKKFGFRLHLTPSESGLSLFLEADFNPSTTITVPAGGSRACIDFTNLVVDDNIALEEDQSFTITVGSSTSMVVIIDDDG